MRLSRAFLAALPLAAAIGGACTNSTETQNSVGTTGTGGTGGGSVTATVTSSTATTSTTSGAGGDNGMPSTDYPAPHPAAPKVITYGGPVLASPKLAPVFFSNDDANMVSQLTDFVAKVGSTQYWLANVQEYGASAATSTTPVNLTETATGTIDDSAIQTWLAGKLNGDDPAWPAPDANTVYLLHYPAGVTITAGGSGQSCTSFGGYHSNITLDANHGNMNVAYAVIPRCDSFGDLTGIDAVTGAESHEMIEAVTDPYPMADPAYASIEDKYFYWQRILGGSETGDMCAQFVGVFTKFSELDYTVQRTWSNKSAFAGHDPCVPAVPGTVYFNSAPVLPDAITTTIMGQSLTQQGVNIPVGMSKTIELDLFSDGDTGGPWTVVAKDTAELFGQTPHLTLSLDRSTGQNGEKLHLTITVNTAGKNNRETFLIASKLGNQENLWLGLVGN